MIILFLLKIELSL